MHVDVLEVGSRVHTDRDWVLKACVEEFIPPSFSEFDFSKMGLKILLKSCFQWVGREKKMHPLIRCRWWTWNLLEIF
ncbi:hypothetical protein CEXT_669281 [Caerostris extrusa]|uniref:Uncharacterized protein n=1 Tax=Caerostris extrusa TaxID=172846 RepID=A0AAV4RTP9_CAEEX|nr:hypothetical protein CEXT_669281 [Caerostris extrusa]